MKIIENIKSIFNKKIKVDNNFNYNFSTYNTNYVDPLSDVTYFTCLKILSEAIAKLPIYLYDGNNKRIYNHNVSKLLNVRPNEYITPSTFKQSIEFNRNHKGNSYVYIHFEKGIIKGLYPLESSSVEIVVNDINNKLYPNVMYQYNNGGKKQYFRATEILHFKSGLSFNGIVGKSILETLKTTFLVSKEGNESINQFYKTGMIGTTFLKVSDLLSKERRNNATKELKRLVEEKQNSFVILPPGVETTIITPNLNQAQYLQLKQYTSNQIAAAFGISPTYLNDYSKSSYSNSEMQNLSFYTDTMLSILKQYEEEINYKLLTEKEREKGYNFKFNLATVLRGDLKTQAEALAIYVNSGIYTVNEARVNSGMSRIKDGDINIVNGSYVKLSDVGLAYNKGGDKNDKDSE